MATLTEREHAIDHTARSSTRGEIEPATEELTIVPQTSLPDLAAIGPKPSPVRAPSEPETTSAPATEPTSADRSAAEAEAAQAEPASNATPKSVRPVAGLSQTQMDHAAVVVQVGQEMGLPKQAYVVAIATVLQESYLKNLANPSYPESFDIPNDGNGTDHDSVGLFQQRPASGWGTVSECMDPEHSARSFYQQLRTVPGWEDLPVTEAAQKVQVSAFPDHYAKHESLAQQIVDALT